MVSSNKTSTQESHAPKDKISYEKLSSQYKTNGKTQVLRRMIIQISRKIIANSNNEMYPIFKMLNRVINELMLNELELALWAIYLEKLEFIKDHKTDKELLLFSALKAKSELTNDIQPYFSFLTKKRCGFKNKYLKWALANETSLEYTPNEINDKFTELTNAADIDATFSINLNTEWAFKDLPDTSSIKILLNTQENFTNLKRQKLDQDTEENRSRENKYFEIGGRIFILEDIETSKRSEEIKKVNFIIMKKA